LFDLDDWLRRRLGDDRAPPPLAAVGRRLVSLGVTGLTDATPGNGPEAMRAFADAISCGALPQRLVVMGKLALEAPVRDWSGRLSLGPVKIMLSERSLPDFDELSARVRAAHEVGREVAIHCVTRAELVFATAVLASVGSRPGDRIEHASVAPPEALTGLAKLGLQVVTQPNFVRERGDAYLAEVELRDRPWLYRCRGLQEGGVGLGGGTDAPFGEPNPWLAMQAAVDRRTAEGEELGPSEALSPEAALALFTTSAHAPGGAPRRIERGAVADFCLLDCSWRVAREELSGDRVRAAICAGEVL